MPKFEKKDTRPTVEAIQIRWTGMTDGVRLRSGDWLILHPDGSTTYTSNPNYMAENYRKVD